MKYIYFESHFYTKNDNAIGFGNSEVVSRPDKINTIDQIRQIENELNKSQGYKSTIISLVLLRLEDD